MSVLRDWCEKLNIIHRDIKPDNILVAADGTCKLCDFGIARHIDRLKSVLSVKGTYTYMAPEIYHGNKYGKSVDIYSLGILLYRLMNRNRDAFINPGKQMVYYRDREEALRRRMGGEILPAPADATPEFAQIIRKACAYSAKDRYESPSAMKKDLQLLSKGEYHITEEAGQDRKAVITPGLLTETLAASSKEEKQKKTVKSHFFRVACLCLAFCLLAATGVTWYSIQKQKQYRPERKCGRIFTTVCSIPMTLRSQPKRKRIKDKQKGGKTVENWWDLDFEGTVRDFDFTRKAIRNMNRVLDSEQFQNMDAQAIYQYLFREMELVSFKDYLKRYIYERAEIEEPFFSVPDEVYREIICFSSGIRSSYGSRGCFRVSDKSAEGKRILIFPARRKRYTGSAVKTTWHIPGQKYTCLLMKR